MLPDFGFSEMIVVAVIALIVVGPKDLPVMMRRLGQFLARMRGIASEFRSSFDDMARQSELDELRKEVEAMRLDKTERFNDPDAARRAEITDVYSGAADTAQMRPLVDPAYTEEATGLRPPAAPAGPPRIEADADDIYSFAPVAQGQIDVYAGDRKPQRPAGTLAEREAAAEPARRAANDGGGG